MIGLAYLVIAILNLPTVTPYQAVTDFEDIGQYALSCRFRDGRVVNFPIGWAGDFDDLTGVACRLDGTHLGKKSFLLHAPWRGGTGTVDQAFHLKLPKAGTAKLTGFVALGTRGIGKSDGVVFLVYLDDKLAFESFRKDEVWQPYSIDLSSFLGRDVLIRFETDPGPKNDPSYDFSVWGDRRLVLTGFQTKPFLRQVNKLRSTAAPSKRDDVVPTENVGQPIALDGKVIATEVSGDLGSYRLTHVEGRKIKSLPFGNSAHIEWDGPASLRSSRYEQTKDGRDLVRVFETKKGTATVRSSLRFESGSIVFKVVCDQPVIRSFDSAGWGPVDFRKEISVPYYSGHVFYLPEEDIFVNSFLDWRFSNASSQEGTKAVYGAKTDGTRNCLSERVVFAFSPHLAGVLPNIPNPKSPFIQQVGGRLMLDIWGPKFSDISTNLEKLNDYGINRTAAIVHVWQRSGYDNELPAHFPANAELGGDTEMQKLVKTATKLGCLLALHENYVDYYPNFEGFKESDIALSSNGELVKAWLNEGTKVQSFAVKPNAIMPLAKSQSPEIHRRYGTNADYLDVHSAVPPWFHVDYRASESGAAEFKTVFDTHQELWAFERKTHGGPVFGEGNNHWWWSGLLDGVEAQFGTGWPALKGLDAPLMVDFDLKRIHPLQANHGMGYYERWWENAQWGTTPPMKVMDQYRMQEIAFGHTGFLAQSTWSVLPYAWLEHHLLTPVTQAYAGQDVDKIEYQVQGKWVDPDEAAIRGDWSIVRITYGNGLVVIANNQPEALRLGSLTLPQFGWAASGAGILSAYTALNEGVVCDFSSTRNEVFANARRLSDWQLSGITNIRPTAVGFAQLEPRKFRLGYRWQVNQALDQDYKVFVHFNKMTGDPYDEGIVFQNDHLTRKPTSTWKVGETIEDGPAEISVPQHVADGSYAVSVGLWLEGSPRLSLRGSDDGQGRIRLGILKIQDNGNSIRFLPNSDSGEGQLALYSKSLNLAEKVIDFGDLRTNGSVRAIRQGPEWVLQTYPRDRSFSLELSQSRFGFPNLVKCDGGTSNSIKPVLKGGYWRLPITGAREYRWATGK